jgi:hypothetical protein
MALGFGSRRAGILRSPPRTRAKYFSPLSLWNRPLTGREAVNPASAQMIASLKQIKPDGDQLQVSAGNGYGIPIYTTSPGDPRYTATDQGGGWTITNVPWPAGTVDASGEGYLVIVDWPANRIYNFYGAEIIGGTIHTNGGGIFTINGPGWYDPSGDPNHLGSWTGCSSNASYLAGVVTPEELFVQKEIPHAICMTCDNDIQEEFPALPAKTTDSWISSSTGQWPNPGVKNGSWFRIRADVDLNTLGLGRDTLIIARAMQTYGFFFIDRGGGISLRFQENADFSAFDQNGLTGTLFNYCQALMPREEYQYDHPGRFNPAEPHL